MASRNWCTHDRPDPFKLRWWTGISVAPFIGQLPGRAQPTAGVTSQELLDGLFRRKGFILLAIIVGGLIAYHVSKALPPWYTASGLLVVDTLKSSIPELDTLTSNRTVEPWGGGVKPGS